MWINNYSGQSSVPTVFNLEKLISKFSSTKSHIVWHFMNMSSSLCNYYHATLPICADHISSTLQSMTILPRALDEQINYLGEGAGSSNRWRRAGVALAEKAYSGRALRERGRARRFRFRTGHRLWAGHRADDVGTRRDVIHGPQDHRVVLVARVRHFTCAFRDLRATGDGARSIRHERHQIRRIHGRRTDHHLLLSSRHCYRSWWTLLWKKNWQVHKNRKQKATNRLISMLQLKTK